MRNILFLICFLSIPIFSFCQWTPLNSTTNQYLVSIQFVNDSTGYCSTENGDIYKSTNGDNNWSLVGNCNSQRIQFVNADTGFAYGVNDVFKSTNGGATWVSKFYSPNVFLQGLKMHFPTTSTGFTSPKNPGGDSIHVFKTTDIGETWNNVGALAAVSETMCIYFIDNNTGFISDEFAQLFRTTNGGVNWNLVFTTSGTSINDIFFPSPTIGYAVSESSYLKTTDGGLNWTETSLPYSPLFHAIDCPSINNCHILGGNGFSTGTLINTTNGGTNWAQSGTSSTTYTDVDFLNDSIGYACGTGGSIIKYTGSGSSSINNYSYEALNLYPNPAGNFTTLSFENLIDEKFRISIYDVKGGLVQTINNVIGDQIKLDLSQLFSGVYCVQLLSTTGKLATTKLIVE